MKQGYMPKAKSQEWETPQKLFDRLNKVFHFTVDLACTEENAKCNMYITKQENHCDNNKSNIGWLNPPYGSDLTDWVRHAFHQVYIIKSIKAIIMLIPSSTEIKAWTRHIWCFAEYVIFLNKRVKFEINGKSVGSSTKGSAIVVFSQDDIPDIYSLSDLGFVIDLEVQRRLQAGEEFHKATGYEVGDIPVDDYIECGLIPAPEIKEIVK